MSYVIFCREGTKKPYIIEDLRLRLFSIEEFCYYIYSNVSLCDQELLKPELALWIEEQCKMPDLAESIRVILRKDPRAERVAAQIFAYTDYLTKQEREAVCERIRKYSQLGIGERKKMRGDYFYLDGKFMDAIRVYQEMLEQENYEDEKMHHGLLYNLGCCFAAMFYYDIAYDCFLKAAELDVSKGEDMVAALFCKKTALSEREWEDFLNENHALASYVMPMEKELCRAEAEWKESALSKELFKLQNHSRGRSKEYYDTMEKYLWEWKKQV